MSSTRNAGKIQSKFSNKRGGTSRGTSDGQSSGGGFGGKDNGGEGLPPGQNPRSEFKAAARPLTDEQIRATNKFYKKADSKVRNKWFERDEDNATIAYRSPSKYIEGQSKEYYLTVNEKGERIKRYRQTRRPDGSVDQVRDGDEY